MAQLLKFQGCLTGAVVGDCLGANFERYWHAVTLEMVQIWYDELQKKELKCKSTLSSSNMVSEKFTDDTAMARGVAQSLIKCETFSAADMARRFTENYFAEPWRGYGGSVGEVFTKLKQEEYKEPFGPAAAQFDGQGSYGNGGAMRVAPVPLFAYNKGLRAVQEIARDSALLTHSHPQAVQGAVLLSTAIWLALDSPVQEALEPRAFLARLRTAFDEHSVLKPTRRSGDDGDKTSPHAADLTSPYDIKLQFIDNILLDEKAPSREDIVEHLGTDISAFESVPAAIYAFLRSNSQIPGLESDNAYVRTVLYAISLGGDTDTVATMAGAVAAAYWGLEAVPPFWRSICEGCDDAMTYAKDLHDMQGDHEVQK